MGGVDFTLLKLNVTLMETMERETNVYDYAASPDASTPTCSVVWLCNCSNGIAV